MKRLQLLFMMLASLSVTQPAPADVAPAPALTQQDVNAWLDGFMPFALNSGDIAGGVVSIVKDGSILTEKGYGYADVATKQPVDPSRTLFRPGSTSKLFTWTAVMQQVELGKIDLDTDVNQYLDFKIPDYAGQAVTMRTIMTHSAGFEEALAGLIVESDHSPPLDAVLKRWIPKRIFAPAKTPAYSNYATVLAGYIVQRVSGEPYEDYIEAHIFKPLGMQHSTFKQPLPPQLAAQMSKGYARASEAARPFETITFVPAGSATSSAGDMARFMLAHLSDQGALLMPETQRLMHSTALTLTAPLNGMALGFYEANRNGLRILAHGGDTQWFHSSLWLIPSKNVGVFVSLNSAGRDSASLTVREALIDGLVNRYFPAPATPDAAPVSPGHAAEVAGIYNVSRRSESGVRRALNLFTQISVTPTADGGLSSSAFEFKGIDGAPRQWVEIQPYVWKDRHSSQRLAAHVENGKVVRLAVDSYAPIMVYDRVPWTVSIGWLRPALIASVMLLAGLLLSLPCGWIARTLYSSDRRLSGRERTAYLSSSALSLATIVLLAVWTSILLTLTFSPLGSAVYALELATVVLVPCLCLASAWFLWTGSKARRPLLTLAIRTALVLASLCIQWFVIAFNLVHIGLDY